MVLLNQFLNVSFIGRVWSKPFIDANWKVKQVNYLLGFHRRFHLNPKRNHSWVKTYNFQKQGSFYLRGLSCGATVTTMSTDKSDSTSGTSFKRLPLNVIPSNYALTFEPNWTNHRYEASATIDIEEKIKETTGIIILNAANFSVTKVLFNETANGYVREADAFLMDTEHELLTINFAKPLSCGSGQLTITYAGNVADNLKGLFRSKYQGLNGEDRYHYLTKFEPTYARNCFPCWDEPSFKTTYDITLIVPKELVAVSNMPVKEEVPYAINKDKKIVKFERSVRMSTYVMAFAVGEFDYVEKRSEDGILCRVYTPVGKRERGNFALDVVTKSLPFYKDYFGIPYPLPKMDLLAVAEFGSGAMENFGLVIFREQLLLMDEKLSSAATKQYVAIVVAHETAHMWFGNLVTMEWWSDLWLNEGFASWMEYHCANTLYPELELWNLFMAQLIEALELDASFTSHPIQVTVNDPAQIGAIFDYISYVKGAAVIRMIHAYLGNDFQAGLSHYLKTHLFGNAETKDLWAALTEKSGEQVDTIMPTFTEQMGFPVVLVNNIQQSGNKKILTLSYEKFWADQTVKHLDKHAYKWSIPITVRKQSEPSGVALKTLVNVEPNTEFTLSVECNDSEWVKINADHVGYFRTTYPSAILETFVPSIKSKEMQPLDRVGILDDLFANVKAGHASSDIILKFLLAFTNEEVLSVWSGIINIIGAIDKLLRDTPLCESFRVYARNLLSPTAEKLGWDPKKDEIAQNSVLRSVLINRLVGLNCANTIEKGRNLFNQHLRGEKEIHPDIRAAVYRSVALEGESGFNALLKVYRQADLLEEKMRILSALGEVTDNELIRKLFEFGRSSEVNKQDMVTIIVSMCDKGKQEVCWEYFKENWEFFRDNLPTGHFLIRRLVACVTSGFKTDKKAAEIEAFFKEHQFKGIERTLSQSLETIRVNKAWLERDSANLEQFLNSY